MKLARITALAAGLALFGMACGGGSTTSGSTNTPATTTPAQSATGGGGPTTTTLTAKDNVFDPATFTFPGGRITLKNAGASLHNFSIEGQDVDHDIKPGETEDEDVEVAPGTYTFFCKYHRAIGMEGTITVSG